VSASVVEMLRFERKSPFYGRIRGLGHRSVEGCNISQAAASQSSDEASGAGGVLSRSTYDASTGGADIPLWPRIVRFCASVVARVWPYVWQGRSINGRNRLVHRVNISSIGNDGRGDGRRECRQQPRDPASVERRLRGIRGAARGGWLAGGHASIALGRATERLKSGQRLLSTCAGGGYRKQVEARLRVGDATELSPTTRPAEVSGAGILQMLVVVWTNTTHREQ